MVIRADELLGLKGLNREMGVLGFEGITKPTTIKEKPDLIKNGCIAGTGLVKKI